MSFDLSGFLGKFVEEARDRLGSLTGALVRLEQTGEAADALADVLRQAHSLKGSARMLGLADVSQLAHELEEVFVAARRDRGLLDAGTFDIVFSAVDVLTLRVERLADGISEPLDVSALCERLAGVVAGRSAAPPTAEPAAPAGESPARIPVPGRPAVHRSLRVPVAKLERLTNLAAEMVLQNLRASDRHTELRRLELALRHVKDRMLDARLTPDPDAADRRTDDHAEALETLSRRLHRFLDLFGDDRVRLNLITEELRQDVIELTMLPLSTVFDAFPRAVRDLARTFHKQVDVTIEGRDTELDKKIIEQIADPLVHLVRNAVDHGIEPPADRVRAGKREAGQLRISAAQRGSRIVISVQDDGQGIDAAAVRAAAIRQGMATDAELDGWSEEDILELVFRPGFSTRRAVTDVSGRGVGLDVVKDMVARLGGTVRIHSASDRGTTVVLDLPLSLALIHVVLVDAGGETFAVPTAAIRQILHVDPEDVVRLQQGPVIEVEGETVPLVPLGAVLELRAAPRRAGRQPVLIVGATGGAFGVVVDEIRQEQELVFKEIRGPLGEPRPFAGASILGSGEIVLILEVQRLFERAGHMPAVSGEPVVSRPGRVRPHRVLIVEDSLVAGELQKNIVRAAGYEAAIVGDGVEALETLLREPWDLVIADVDMPHMDGFELTRRLRADARLRAIPVVIVTARDTADARRRGLEAGADAFIVKREFDQLQLLDTVQRLIGRAEDAGGETEG